MGFFMDIKIWFWYKFFIAEEAIKNNDPSICSQLGNFIKHRCFAQYGIAKSDPSVCDLVQEPDRKICYDEVESNI